MLLRNIEPDFNRILRVLKRDGLPDRVPFAEFYFDQPALAAMLGEKPVFENASNRQQTEECWLQRIRFFKNFGMDFIPVQIATSAWERFRRMTSAKATDMLMDKRIWVSEVKGFIATLEDFEQYRWPNLEELSFNEIDFVSNNLPQGMKIIAVTDGPFELARELMGFETFAMALYDQQDLVRKVFEKIEALLLHVHKRIVQFDTVGAVHLGDDMCYKTGPMMAPELFRQFVFPIHRKIANIAHASGRPFSLHSDGDNTLLMEDLINYVKIDAKHAFEDPSQPVEQVKKNYGDRLALLGGVDMNLLCSRDEKSIRKRVYEIMEICKAGGGFAIGSGNSIASYIPIKNYLLMLNTALEVAWY